MSVVVALASTHDETGEFMPTPAWRIVLDPKVGDLAVDGVGNLAERVGTPHLRLAIRLIHDLHVHAAEALPSDDGQHKVAFSFCATQHGSTRRTNSDRDASSMTYEWNWITIQPKIGIHPGQK